jgi:RHS repeat-associated protein
MRKLPSRFATLVLLALAVLGAACSPRSTADESEQPARRNAALLPPGPQPIAPVPELDSSSSLELDRFGPWQTEFKFNVPAHLGVEPQLALSYSSSGGLGHFGYGWRLRGMSGIERKSATLAPAEMNATDRYFLDGAELIPCKNLPPATPSCKAGGNYAFKDENYQKVNFDKNGWSVWTKHGTEMRFAAVSPLFSGWQWKLQSVTDRNGNRADYQSSERNGESYLTNISYGYANPSSQPSYVVQFRYAPRRDLLSRATPKGLAKTSDRLGRIEVKSFGALTRGYNFRYDDTRSDAAGSFLESIEEVGSDGTIGPDGLFIGSVLPRATFARASRPFVDFDEKTDPPILPVAALNPDAERTWHLDAGSSSLNYTQPNDWPELAFSTTSLNADGVPDFAGTVVTDDALGFVRLLHAKSQRDLTASTGLSLDTVNTTMQNGTVIFRPDLDGDGISDLVGIKGRAVTVARGTPSGSLEFKPTVVSTQLPTTNKEQRFLFADFDGDGRSDLLVYGRDPASLKRAGTTSDPCPAPLEQRTTCDLVGDAFKLIRFLADGSFSVTPFSVPVTSTSQSRLLQGSMPLSILGWGLSSAAVAFLPVPEWSAADLDGDGTSELVLVSPIIQGGTTALELRAHFLKETASGFVATAASPQTIPGFRLLHPSFLEEHTVVSFNDPADVTGRLLWGDFNGDGRSDFLLEHATGTTSAVDPWQMQLAQFRSNGDGTFTAGNAHLVDSQASLRYSDAFRSALKEAREDDVVCSFIPASAPGAACCQGVPSCEIGNQIQVDGRSVLVADFNGDGVDDVLLSNESIQPVTGALPDTKEAQISTQMLLWGTTVKEVSTKPWGTAAPPRATYAVGSQAASPIVSARSGWLLGDFNVDGVVDLAWVDFSDPSNVVVRSFPSVPAPNRPSAIHWLDVTGEGYLDALVLAGNQTSVPMALRTQSASGATPAWSTQSKVVPLALGRADELVWGEFGSLNKSEPDGLADLAIVSPDGVFPSSGTVLKILYSHGDGNFDTQTSTLSGVPFERSRWTVADLNGDKVDELVQIAETDSTTGVRSLARGPSGWNGTVSSIPLGHPWLGAGEWQPARLRGGETVEFIRMTPVVASNPPQLKMETLRANGLTWAASTTTVDLPLTAASEFVRGRYSLSDINADGLSDLVHFSASQLVQIVRTGLVGAGEWQGVSVTIPPPSGGVRGQAMNPEAWQSLDVDGDGFEDRVQFSRDYFTGKNYLNLLHRMGTDQVVWEQIPGRATGGPELRRIAADFDGDGRPDLLSSAFDEIAGKTSFGRTLFDFPASRMTTQANGFGLTINVRYKSSIGAHLSVPSGLLDVNVAGFTTEVLPGRDFSNVELKYSGFRYSVARKSVLGFEVAEASLFSAVNGPKLSVRMDQSDACAGRRMEETYGQGNAEQSKKTLNWVGTNTSGQYRCDLSQETHRVTDDAFSSFLYPAREIRTRYRYDIWGNLDRLYSDGEFADSNADGVDDLPNDNRRIETEFLVPNMVKYLVDLPMTIDHWGSVSISSRERFSYDQLPLGTPATLGNLTSRESWRDDTAKWIGESFSHWPTGTVRRATSPGGVWREFTYDSAQAGRVTRECNALFCKDAIWSIRHLSLETSTDENGVLTPYSYDVFGRPVRTIFSDGGCVMKSYLMFGVPGSQATFEGVCTTANEDVNATTSLGVLTNFDGLVRPWRYSRRGVYERKVAYWGTTTLERSRELWHDVGQPARAKSSFFDTRGRLVRVVNPDGSSRGYDYSPWTTLASDENGALRLSEQDAFGNLVTAAQWYSTEGRWVVVRHLYDDLNRRTQSVDGNGYLSTSQFNSLGWLGGECDPDRGCSTYTRDDDGRVTSAVDSRGKSQTLVYDSIGRLKQRYAVRAGVPVDLERIDWDFDSVTGLRQGFSIGRQVRRFDETGDEKFWYDSRGRDSLHRRCTTAAGTQRCNEWSRDYDLVGRLQTLKYPDSSGTVSTSSEGVRTDYDDFGRLRKVASGLQVYVSSVDYNASDLPVRTVFGNGVVEIADYDPARLWLKQKSVDVQRGNGLSMSYEYDPVGQPLVHDWSTGTAQFGLQFGYDVLGRLTTVGGALTQAFQYDDTGRIVYNSSLGVYSYNAVRQVNGVRSAGRMSLDYDNSGNATSIDVLPFEWNEDGRLVRSSSPAQGLLEWGYDGSGDRTFKIVRGQRTFFFDDVVENGPLGRKLFYKAGARVIATRESFVLWLHSDLSGSTRATTDATGAVVDLFSYEPFGSEVLGTSSPATFGFAGRRFDDETGLVYMGSRYYHPRLGRFISADSIVPDAADPQSLDRYAFATNSPVRYVDPDGHAKKESNFIQLLNASLNLSPEFLAPEAPSALDLCIQQPQNPLCGKLSEALASSATFLGSSAESVGKADVKSS